VTATSLALRDQHVLVSDPDPDVVQAARAGVLTIHEPELNDEFARAVTNGLIRVVDIDAIWSLVEPVWIAVDTPMHTDSSADMRVIDDIVNALARRTDGPQVVLVSSQIPVGTTRSFEDRLGPDRCVAYLPENLRLGRAMKDFAVGGPLIVGTRSPRAVAAVRSLFPERPLTLNDPETAELTKHATNAFLAETITFANRIGDLAREVGADAYAVEANLRMDNRIGTGLPLRPGAPFSGGTLARDLRAIAASGEHYGLDTSWLHALLAYNEQRVDHLLSLVERMNGRPLDRVLLLGWVYKADTTSTRDAPGLRWHSALIRRGAEVVVYEPALPAGALGPIAHATDLSSGLRRVDAVIVTRPGVCEVPEFTAKARESGTGVVLDLWRWLAPDEHGIRVIEPGRHPA
jgi:UDPglucose 6-dehydrogenase